jgi:flagellar basal body-associated protein FliL
MDTAYSDMKKLNSENQESAFLPAPAAASAAPTTGAIIHANQVWMGVPIYAPAVDARAFTEHCWLCNTSDVTEESGCLFTPCLCHRPVHRGCFRRWRQGWINPSNYFKCPLCDTKYNIERVRSDANTITEAEVRRRYNKKVAWMWVGIVVALAALIAAIAGIAYGCDTSKKNVPVAMKYLMTSVASGMPPKNATAIWEAEFKEPQYHVWPYYSLLSAVVVSLMILIAAPIYSCRFEEKDRSSRSCGDQCCTCTCNNCCEGCYYWWWFNSVPPYRGNRTILYGGPTGNGSNNCCCCPGSSCNGCSCDGCGKCDANSCDCKGGGGNLGEGAAILILVVVVIVLISAIFVIIFFAIRRMSLIHDRLTDMLLNQQLELESQTIVLGVGETLRPIDQV